MNQRIFDSGGGYAAAVVVCAGLLCGVAVLFVETGDDSGAVLMTEVVGAEVADVRSGPASGADVAVHPAMHTPESATIATERRRPSMPF